VRKVKFCFLLTANGDYKKCEVVDKIFLLMFF